MTPQERELREKNRLIARERFLNGALTGSVTWGTVGIALHFAGQRLWPMYKNKFNYVGKTFMVTSFFIAGFAINGENAVQRFLQEERERRTAERMASYTAVAAKGAAAQAVQAAPAPLARDGAEKTATSPAVGAQAWLGGFDLLESARELAA